MARCRKQMAGVRCSRWRVRRASASRRRRPAQRPAAGYRTVISISDGFGSTAASLCAPAAKAAPSEQPCGSSSSPSPLTPVQLSGAPSRVAGASLHPTRPTLEKPLSHQSPGPNVELAALPLRVGEHATLLHRTRGITRQRTPRCRPRGGWCGCGRQRGAAGDGVTSKRCRIRRNASHVGSQLGRRPLLDLCLDSHRRTLNWQTAMPIKLSARAPGQARTPTVVAGGAC